LDEFLKFESTLKKIKPHIIINACAKTNLNWCEKNTSNSFIVNALYAERLALLSEKLSSKFIHLSTDQLFSSSKVFQ
jgi:dTDP-4-dehydrorhamnose reductase